MIQLLLKEKVGNERFRARLVKNKNLAIDFLWYLNWTKYLEEKYIELIALE